MKSSIVYYSSWFGSWLCIAVLSGIWLLSVLQHGFMWDFYTQVGLIATGLCFLVILWSRYRTYLAITHDNYLINVGARKRWWGSLIMFYGDAGLLTFVREKAYDDSVVRALLLKLKHLRPDVKFDPDYDRFLKDEGEGGTWLSEHPASRTVTQVERSYLNNHL
jgi:hypothetical protein